MTRGSGPWWALTAIAGISIVGGLVQLVYPPLLLDFLGAVVSPTSRYAFGIVGMFVALFGGMLLHSMRSDDPQPVAVMWVAVEKVLGCFVALFGIFKGFFSSGALALVLFDFFAALLVIWYWRTIRWPVAYTAAPAQAGAAAKR